MRIAVMGAGALGCYIGGRLAVAGRDVSFVARGTQLDALDCQGLRIESPLGNARIEKVFATPDPKQIGAVELIVFLVKLYDTETAARTMMPLLSPKTSVVSFPEWRRWMGAHRFYSGQRQDYRRSCASTLRHPRSRSRPT